MPSELTNRVLIKRLRLMGKLLSVYIYASWRIIIIQVIQDSFRARVSASSIPSSEGIGGL